MKTAHNVLLWEVVLFGFNVRLRVRASVNVRGCCEIFEAFVY